MLETSITRFLDGLSSKEPVPGGGGASAYVGALAMALGLMVGNLTIGKKKYQEVEADIKILMEKGQHLMNRLKDLVAEDADAFYPLSLAYGLPQNTPEEVRNRDMTLQKALVKATLVPLEIARNCARVIDLQEELALKGSRIAVSDVGVGAALARAALKSAKLNVLINTQLMKDRELKRTIENELSELDQRYTEKADKLYASIEEVLSGGDKK